MPRVEKQVARELSKRAPLSSAQGARCVGLTVALVVLYDTTINQGILSESIGSAGLLTWAHSVAPQRRSHGLRFPPFLSPRTGTTTDTDRHSTQYAFPPTLALALETMDRHSTETQRRRGIKGMVEPIRTCALSHCAARWDGAHLIPHSMSGASFTWVLASLQRCLELAQETLPDVLLIVEAVLRGLTEDIVHSGELYQGVIKQTFDNGVLPAKLWTTMSSGSTQWSPLQRGCATDACQQH